MPRKAIDFDRLLRLVSMGDVLRHIAWRPAWRGRDRVRGPCKLHLSLNSRSKTFEAWRDGYHCWKCGARGDQIHFWAELNGLDDYTAALELCGVFKLEVPWRPRRPRQPREEGTEMRHCAGAAGVSPASSSTPRSGPADDQAVAADQDGPRVG
jgi:hypothetical protein